MTPPKLAGVRGGGSGRQAQRPARVEQPVSVREGEDPAQPFVDAAEPEMHPSDTGLSAGPFQRLDSGAVAESHRAQVDEQRLRRRFPQALGHDGAYRPGAAYIDFPIERYHRAAAVPLRGSQQDGWRGRRQGPEERSTGIQNAGDEDPSLTVCT